MRDGSCNMILYVYPEAVWRWRGRRLEGKRVAVWGQLLCIDADGDVRRRSFIGGKMCKNVEFLLGCKNCVNYSTSSQKKSAIFATEYEIAKQSLQNQEKLTN